MKKKWIWILIPLVVVLAAAAGVYFARDLIWPPAVGQTTGLGDARQMTLEQKLAPGIFLLEESDLAVTAEQASAMLPLWKALRSLSTSDTTSEQELNALYKQIEGTLTGEQLAAVEEADFGGEAMAALMDKRGIQVGGPGAMGDLTEGQRATMEALLQEGGPGNIGDLTEEQIAAMRDRMQEGGFAFGGQGPGGGGGFGGGGMMPGGTGVGDGTQATPDASTMTRRIDLGMNRMFLEPLIQLLQERAQG